MKHVQLMLLSLVLAWSVLPVQAQTSAAIPPEAAVSASSASDQSVPAVMNNESSSTSDTPERAGMESWQERPWERWRERGGRGDSAKVMIGSNAVLNQDERAEAVVAIAGNADVAGEVSETVVAVLGNTRVTGPVGEAVVTVLGNSYINNVVDGDVVTMLGNVQLGPQADIRGELVTIGGTVQRDAAATVDRMQTMAGAVVGVDFNWLRNWLTDCVFKGRLLSFNAELGWAWGVALVSLLLYVLTAAIMPLTVAHNVRMLETWPGRSLLVALVSIPLTPVLFLLLVITVVGIFAIPFVGMGLLTMAWFGKLVMLAWLGNRLLRTVGVQQERWVLATLIGGGVVTLLYTIPVVGMLVYHVLNFIGFGVVLYSLLLMFHWASPTPPAARNNGRQSYSRSAEPLTTEWSASQTTQADNKAGDQADHLAASASQAASSGFTATPSAVAQHSYATFWQRMGALAIDVALIGLLTGLLGFIDFFDRHLLLPLAVYGALMWKLRGTTIGGIVMHLQVQREDGRELDWTTSIVRALGCFLSLFALGLGFIWIALDRDHQAWHDKIAGTVVVRMQGSKPLF